MRAHQRGAALLMAMIIVTLVATLAGSMIWQQWRAVQVETAERARTQSAWILTGALDWARLILREDARAGGPDHLGEPWAVPLAEARLSTFLAADRDAAGDEGPDAFLSGFITDAQARYNLRNLIDQDKVVPGELEVLGRLCETAGVAPGLAAQIANGLLEASRADNGTEAPLMPHGIDELFWLGVDPEALQRLAPYVVLLPARTPVNVNTAQREVLAAVVDGLDLASAERLVQLRQRTPFRRIEDVKRQLPGSVTLQPSRIGISSNFFFVTGRLRLEQRVLQERSLVERKGLDIVPLRRQRVNLQDPAG
ncbi:MAG: type II secretion system minor pseudopilin GspK [Betaproteobacteria bacterium]